MVYTTANQTQQYSRIRQHYQTTHGHFHDDPVQLEPAKLSTVGKLYENSLYFMEKRLEKAQRKATHTEIETLGSTTLPTYKTLSIPGSWSGRLPPCYEGNGTFRLDNSLTYSVKPVKLVPYSAFNYRTEYGSEYSKKAGLNQGYGKEHFSTLRSSRR